MAIRVVQQESREVFRRLFAAHFGVEPASVLPMEADGSSRVMYRVVGPDYQTAVGVVGPDREENRAFLSYSRAFRAAGLKVPEIFEVDEQAGMYLEEDLGETTLFDALTITRRREPRAEFPPEAFSLYQRVVEELPRFQVLGGRVVDYSVAYPRAAFDKQSILWDLNYFKYHFLKLAHIPFNEARLEEDFLRLTGFLLRADKRHFLYRDFQSRNIMIRDGEPWFIDYQGGRQGALQYDIASLLYDAKAAIPEPARERILDHYLDSLHELLPLDRDLFREHYKGYVLVRILQALGAYGYRGFFERKPRFLQSVPPAVENIEQILERNLLPLPLPELRATLERICASDSLRKKPVRPAPGLTINVGSFSYKHGYPEDTSGHGGGFVFDCRALHNPGRYEEYTELCGCDAAVVEFLESDADVEAFWQNVRDLVDKQVRAYQKRGFDSLSVHFGCTGGQHRSVYFAERLTRFLRKRFPGIHVQLTHREEPRWRRVSASARSLGPTSRAVPLVESRT